MLLPERRDERARPDRMGQSSAKMSQSGAKMGQNGPKWGRNGAKHHPKLLRSNNL
jgi:hypothetical protein